ncbi:MAG: hypothetical protein IH623_22255 [Verrucomicrobia bacterium]|nr:hypothetical protein [Verrucomicrobiota bacterium]
MRLRLRLRLLCVLAFIGVSCLTAQATITLNISAGELRSSDGTELMPIGGQVFLVASTTDTLFGAPRADYFVSGDDVILFRWSLQEIDEGPGYFSGTAPGLDLGDFIGLNSGDPLQMYWYPTLTADATEPGEGTPFGFYRHPTGLDESAPWVVPSDGSIVSLNFFTVGSVLDGSNANELGWASFTVAPVPEASNLIFGGLALGLVAFRFVPQLRRKLAKS